MRILVLGGTGFIGRNLCEMLIKKNYKVDFVGRTNFSLPISESYDATSLKQIDIKNLDRLVSDKYTHIINLSGYIDHSNFYQGGWEVINSHLFDVINFLHKIDKSKLVRFVQIGSSDEYGDNLSPQVESYKTRPFSPYSFAKSAMSEFLQMMHTDMDFPSVTLRLFLVYGKYQKPDRFLPQIILGCLRGKKIPMSEGIQLRDFCHVEDICYAILACLENDKVNGEVINIASGTPIAIRDLALKVQEIIGSGEIEIGANMMRENENMSLYADIDKAKEILSWSPKIDLEQGLRYTIEYYREL